MSMKFINVTRNAIFVLLCCAVIAFAQTNRGGITGTVTDATSLTGGTVYDFDLESQARTSAGIIVQQSPDVTASLDYRYLNALSLTTLGAGVAYRLANQYTLNLTTSYDLTSNQFQGAGAEIRRDFQSMRLGFNIAHNNISGETSVGFTLTPRIGESRGRIPILGEQAPAR